MAAHSHFESQFELHTALACCSHGGWRCGYVHRSCPAPKRRAKTTCTCSTARCRQQSGRYAVSWRTTRRLMGSSEHTVPLRHSSSPSKRESCLFSALGVFKGNTGAVKSRSGMSLITLTSAVCHKPEVCIPYGTYSAHVCHQGGIEFQLRPHTRGKWTAMQLAAAEALCCRAGCQRRCRNSCPTTWHSSRSGRRRMPRADSCRSSCWLEA